MQYDQWPNSRTRSAKHRKDTTQETTCGVVAGVPGYDGLDQISSSGTSDSICRCVKDVETIQTRSLASRWGIEG